MTHQPVASNNADRAPAPWKVYFRGGFEGRHGRSRAGREIIVNRQLDWAGQTVLIPRVYSCAKGLVVDVCIKVSAEDVYEFTNKWLVAPQQDDAPFTQEQAMLMNAKNPLAVSFTPEAVLNGKALDFTCGSGLVWNPCLPEENDVSAQNVLAHYGLDAACGWAIFRLSFLWATSCRPQIDTLCMTLRPNAVPLPGPIFGVLCRGESVSFVHPTTGTKHTLTVQQCLRQQMPQQQFGTNTLIFPQHYTTLDYTLSPDLPQNALSLIDRTKGDEPRQNPAQPAACPTDAASDAAAVGIIGGADGPTAIFLAENEQPNFHTACSAFHFEAEYEAAWQLLFHEKTRPELALELI